MLKQNLVIAAASAFLLASPAIALAQSSSPGASPGSTSTSPGDSAGSTSPGPAGSGVTRPNDNMQNAPATPGRTTQSPGSTTQSDTTRGTMTGPSTTTGPSSTTSNTLRLADVEGKDVVNANGDTIGTVEGIVGNNVILSVGGFLGMGKKHVSVPSSSVTMSGTGDDAELVTTLTEEELKAMPEYERPATGSSTTR